MLTTRKVIVKLHKTRNSNPFLRIADILEPTLDEPTTSNINSGELTKTMKKAQIKLAFCGICFVFSLASATTVSAASLTGTKSSASNVQTAAVGGGVVEGGAIATIGVALLQEVKTAIQSLGKAVAYAKAKTDGPDSDDRAVKFNDDQDHGLDWSLDANTGLIRGKNNVDDREETPYTPGDTHFAKSEIHFKSTGGVWRPNPTVTVGGKKQEFGGWVSAKPEDDPTVANQKTSAAAAAAFSADGKNLDFCYSAGVESTGGVIFELEKLQKVDCSTLNQPPRANSQLAPTDSTIAQDAPLPEFALEQGAVFLASVKRFAFDDVGGDLVSIHPLFNSTVDLFHSYIQQDSNSSILPVLEGYDIALQELKQEGYGERIEGTDWVLSENSNETADLTIVGAGLQFNELFIPRGGLSNAELLQNYFTGGGVSIVAPSHAQQGYVPQLTFFAPVTSGQDISTLIGRDFVIPQNGDPSIAETDPLFGLAFGVSGGIDNAVELALNTEGNFVRDLATQAWDGQSDTVAFAIPGTNFHYENASGLVDIAVASPNNPNDPNDPKKVPEPRSVLGIFAVGGLGLLTTRKKPANSCK